VISRLIKSMSSS